MIVYNAFKKFFVLDKEINLHTENFYFGSNTVAEMDGNFYYLGPSENSNISSAIFTWQEISGRDLTNDELRQVLRDNDIISAHSV